MVCVLYRLLFGSFKKLTFHHVFIITYIIFIQIRALGVYKSYIESVEHLVAVFSIPIIYALPAWISQKFFVKSNEDALGNPEFDD